MEIRQAVILAGGQGKRLRPWTFNNNKVMYPINGKPFLWHLIKLLKKNGIKKVLVLTGWQADKVKANYPGMEISYHHTPFKSWFREIQSTIRVKKACHLLDDYFLLMYCDNWWPLNLKKRSLGYVTYKNIDIGFFILPKWVIKELPNSNVPIEQLFKKHCPIQKTNQRYYSISDPIRAQETARYLKHAV